MNDERFSFGRLAVTCLSLGLGLASGACAADDAATSVGSDEDGTLGQVAQAYVSPVAAEVRAGTLHTCVRRYDGRVTCWGQASGGQMGDGISPPPSTQASLSTDVLGIGPSLVPGTWLATGGHRACERMSNKTLKCWGTSSGGWPGGASGPTPATVPLTPVLQDVDQVYLPKRQAGFGHPTAACIRTIGVISCWGGNNFGQLATGTTDNLDHPTPVKLTGLGSNVSDLSMGESHTCARLGGTVTCWGVNTSGELGNGTTTSTASVGGPIAGLTGVTQIATGVAHTCVLKSDGTIRCWGGGGLIGDGTTTKRLTPKMPVQFSYAAEIVAGARHTCARMTDNTVQCWGFNVYGQLGNGTNTSSLIPTVVPGLSNVAQLTAGENHTCALTNAGTVHCWGKNGYGELGDGTFTNRSTPTQVANLPGF